MRLRRRPAQTARAGDELRDEAARHEGMAGEDVSTAARGCAAMVNLIGVVPDIEPLLALPGVHPHVYGKAPRPGRKVGHVTVRADSGAALKLRLAEVQEILGVKAV